TPFDHEKADMILCSSNGIDFHIFRLFLSLASPFFETLFDLPQPSEETNTDTGIRDGLPVIPVSESSKTLDSLLHFCYPCTLAEDPVLNDFREIVDVLDSTKKYSPDTIQQAVNKSLFIPKILETNSLHCFAITGCTCMQDKCELAAKCTLQEPLIPGWFEEVELITSAELLSLLPCAAAPSWLLRVTFLGSQKNLNKVIAAPVDAHLVEVGWALVIGGRSS
ncbi:hypothetical protein F5J12DRAFT_727057, partial [Pisolithus orientalis]|uniref:uncharacterized protein n=1 Tax=Pisolithus orientalis TaxID=936130 RepID=UPI00222493CE